MGIFRLKMGKNYCDIWNSILEFAEMQKIVRNKKHRIWDQNASLGILGCKFEKVLSYFKSSSLNLSKCKVSCKFKNP